MMRSFSSFRRKPLPIPPPGPLLAQTEAVDEEICPGYNSKRFYPAKPGEVLADRYQILVKVGWGTSSTVWFAHEPEGVVALKISNTSSHTADDERDIEEHIAKTDPSHRGFPLFRTFTESFEVTGPEGKHVCLAYEPMRAPIWLFQTRFKTGMIPLPIVKTYILFLLAGLDYLHTGCRIVHTDLKLENIMVTFEDPAVLGRPVYRCHNEFGPLRALKNLPEIVDFGLSTKLDCEEDWGVYPIQPDHYRAPEVILGCGWRMSADIWNLGILLWDLLQSNELFLRVYDAQDKYDAKAHLAEMIALLGPPPQELVARSHAMRDYQWPESIRKEDGTICENAEQYFGGPFFDEDGNFLYNDLIPDRKLVDTVPTLDGNERDKFLSFVKMMLAWVPEERKTARELMEHPFLRRK
ncbi:CMGC protein kinase [Aspergillus minisclerotigenes]|uniref:CMGC protein kinase n=1 Tax=Aspergillus minisclerotigenes TaxID=656917 RepID=A0A5N6JHC8_9EURO|nr:CMGC protein kinase [Aspergillus minisclerotigenes]